jgi:VanZ family protein
MNEQPKIISFFQFQLPMIAWMLFIFIASSIPSTKIAMLGGISDKFVHAGVFSVLCWLTHVALFHQGNPLLRRYSLIIAILFTAIFGLSDEYHQMFTPGRSTDPLDLLADSIGGLIYASVSFRLRFYRDE